MIISRYFNYGVDDIVSVEVSSAELEARIRGRMRVYALGDQLNKSTIYSAGELSLDISMNEVTIGQSSLKLTPIETKILQCFLEKPDWEVCQEELEKRVFQRESSCSNVLNVHLANMRKKLNGVVTGNYFVPLPDRSKWKLRISDSSTEALR